MFRYGPHAHHPVFGVLFLILLGALVVLAVLAVSRFWTARTAPTGAAPRVGGPGIPQDPALTELRLRYARGEITPDDYLQRVAGLGYRLPPGTWVPGPSVAPPTPPGPT